MDIHDLILAGFTVGALAAVVVVTYAVEDLRRHNREARKNAELEHELEELMGGER